GVVAIQPEGAEAERTHQHRRCSEKSHQKSPNRLRTLRPCRFRRTEVKPSRDRYITGAGSDASSEGHSRLASGTPVPLREISRKSSRSLRTSRLVPPHAGADGATRDPYIRAARSG